MSNNQQNIPIPLFNIFIDTIKKIGVEKTQTVLIQSSKYNSVDNFPVVQIIQNAVCREFKIPLHRLLEEKTKGTIRADATRVLTFLLSEILGYKRKDIVDNQILDYNNTSYRNHINYIKELNPKIKDDRDLLAHINNIKTEIQLELQNKNITLNTNTNGKAG